MALTVVQKTARGLLAIGLLFLLSVIASAILSYRTFDLDFWARHTHMVIESLKDTLNSLEDVETGERGYRLTHNPIFLEPYHWGVDNSRLRLNAVEALSRDNPVQRDNMVKLKELAEEKIQLSDRSVRSKSNDDPDLVKQQVKGKQIMDQCRKRVSQMIDVENALLQRRVDDLRVTEYASWASIGLAAAISLGLMVWISRITKGAMEEEQRRVLELTSEIDARKKSEAALKAVSVNLARSNADLQQFAYVASHDLQEPLRAVTGFLTLLVSKQEGKLDADSQRYINHAVEGAHRMRALVNDLLAYARVESRGKEFELVSLEKVLDRVKTDLFAVIEEAQAEISTEPLPEVKGDATQLGQLFQNLISNGIKFRGSQPCRIKIGVSTRSNEWLFAVQDNGRGFEMEHAERIFVIFQRLQGREEAAGTGIGLALCKKIVERHNGQIWAEAKPGEGATFFFTLPK